MSGTHKSLIIDHRGVVGFNRNRRREETDYFPHSEASVKMETDPISETPSLTKISKQKINYNMMANVQQIKKLVRDS